MYALGPVLALVITAAAGTKAAPPAGCTAMGKTEKDRAIAQRLVEGMKSRAPVPGLLCKQVQWVNVETSDQVAALSVAITRSLYDLLRDDRVTAHSWVLARMRELKAATGRQYVLVFVSTQDVNVISGETSISTGVDEVKFLID